MLTCRLVMSLPVAMVALLVARWEYRRHGRLTWLGLGLLCAMLLVPNFVVEFATRYTMPATVPEYTGVLIAALGLVLCVLGMTAFRSMPKIFCLATGELSVAGVYRFSRNPQYLGWILFLAGFCLNDWSWWCLAALAVEAVSLHVLVLIEEEHLEREFGQPYAEFCRRVPRYFPLPSAFLQRQGPAPRR